MNNRGFRGRGIGPRGVPGNNASAASFSGPRFPHPNFRPLRPLLNRPAGPRTWTVRSPRARPYMHWQSNGITRFQNFPRHNVQFRPNTFATQFRPHNRGRPPNVRPGGHFSGNVMSSAPYDYESDSNLRSNEPDVNKDDVPDSLSQQVPLPGSEEERQQKIAETANRLKEKLSSISKENMISFWEDDFSILKPITSEQEIAPDKTTADPKYGSPELDLTFNDFRDIGRVRSDSSSKTDMVDGTDSMPVLHNEVEIIKVVVQETIENLDDDPAFKVPNLENDVEVCNKTTESFHLRTNECSAVNTSNESDVKDSQLNSNNVSVALPLQSQEPIEKFDGHCTIKDCTTEHNHPSHTDIQQPDSFCTKRADNKIDKIHHQLHNLPQKVQHGNSPNIGNIPESERLIEAQNSQQIVGSDIALNSGLCGNHKKELNQSILPQGQPQTTKPGKYGECTISQQTSSISSTLEHTSGRKIPNQSQNMKEQPQITILPFNFDASVPPPNNNLSQSKDFGNEVVQSVVCSTPKSNKPSNYTLGNKGDLLQSPLGFDPRTPPPTFTQNNKTFGKVNTFYSQTQPSGVCDQREYLQPPLAFDPRLSTEERTNLLAHVSNDALRPNCIGSSDSVPNFNTSAVSTNFFQMPPVVPPLNFTSDIRMNYLPILPHVTSGPQVPLHKLKTSTMQMPYECTNQVLKPVVLEHTAISRDLEKKTSEHMNNELEDMQEAMEFAKQVMSMSDKVNDISDIRIPECPKLPSTPSSSSTSNEKVSRDVHSHPDLTANLKTSTRNKEKKVKTDTTQHFKPLLKKHEKEARSKPPSHMQLSNTNSDNAEIQKDVLLKDDQFRSKVTFNLNTKVKKIQSDKWQEKMKDNDKRVKEMMKAKKSKDKDLVTQRGTAHDTCKNKKISKEHKSDASKSKEVGGIIHGSKESSSTVIAKHITVTPVEICNVPHEKVNTENVEIDTTPIVTQKSLSTSKSSKKPLVSVVESSWKNRVINRFLRMSKNDICNMVNNSSLRKFDIAMKHLVKERRSSLSLELRNTEEEKIKSYDREEFMNQLNAMLDPSAVVDISNLPTEFIHHLSEVLQLDPMPFDTEQSLFDTQAMSPSLHETNQNVSELNTQYGDCENSQNQTVFDNTCGDSVKDDKKHDEMQLPSMIKLDIDPPIDKRKTLSSDEIKTSNTPKTSTPMFNMVDLDDIFSEVIAKVQNASNPVQSNKTKKACADPEKVHPTDRKQFASDTQDSLNTCDELVSNSHGTIADFDDIFSVAGAGTKSRKKGGDDRTQENTTIIEDKCSSKMEPREWTRCDRDDSVAFRNLTKEEWEARYGALQQAEDESRSSGFHNKVMYDMSDDQYRRNRGSRRVSSTDSSKRRLSISPENFHTSQHLSEQEFFNSDDHTSSHRNHRILRTSDSSTSEASSSDSSNQSSEDVSKVDVVKLLKVIKEKEKIAKTRSLSETLRDEISAEIERSRSEKSKHRERKSRKREKKRKEKKGKRRKQKKKRRKKITDSDSSNSNAADAVTQPRLLTENEIKKEVPVKDENNTEIMNDIDIFSHATDDTCSKEMLIPAPRCDLPSKKSVQMPMTIVPAIHLKTKAQLKQMPETSENYVRTETTNCASVSSTCKADNGSIPDIKEEKASKAAKRSISTQEPKMDKRAMTLEDNPESLLNATKQHEQGSDPRSSRTQDIATRNSVKQEVSTIPDDKHKKQQNNDVIPEKIKDVYSFNIAQVDDADTTIVPAEHDTTTSLEKNSAREKEMLKNKAVHDSLGQDNRVTEEKSSITSEKPLKKLDIETYKKRMQRRKYMEQDRAKRSATKTSSSSESLLHLPSTSMEKMVCEAALNATTNLEDTLVKSGTDPKPDCLPSQQKDIITAVSNQNIKIENKGVGPSEQRHVHNKKPTDKAVNTPDTKDTAGTKPFNPGVEFEKIVEDRINIEITKMSTDSINPSTENSVPTETVKAKMSTSSADSLKVQPSTAGKLLTDTTAHVSKFSKIRSEGVRELKLRKEHKPKTEEKDSLVKEHGSKNHDKRNLVAVSTETKQVCHENINEVENNSMKKTRNIDTIDRSKSADIDNSEKNADLQRDTDHIITNDNTVKEDVQMQLTNSPREKSPNEKLETMHEVEKLETVHEVIKNEEAKDTIHDSLNTSTDELNANHPFKSISDSQSETVNEITCENDNESNELLDKTVHDTQAIKDSSTFVQTEQISYNVKENYKSVVDDIKEKSPLNLMTVLEISETTINKEENLSHDLTDSSNARISDTENSSAISQAFVTNNLKEEELQLGELSTLLNSADAMDVASDHQDIVCSPVNTNILSPESSNSPFKGFTEEISTCICTKQSGFTDISLQISDTEKHDGLEDKNVLLESSLTNVCYESPTNNTTDVPCNDLEKDANAPVEQSSNDFGKHQSTGNITSDERVRNTLKVVLVPSQTQEEKESVLVNKVITSKKCADDLIAKESSKEKQVCDTNHSESGNPDVKNKPDSNKNSSEMISTSDSHEETIPVPLSEDTVGISQQTIPCDKIEYHQNKTAQKKKENNPSNKPCDDIKQSNTAAMNVQATKEKDRMCTDVENSTQPNAQSKGHTCSEPRRELESRSTVNYNKLEEEAAVTTDEGISNSKELLLESRSDEDRRITAATLTHTSKSSDSVQLSSTRRETEFTCDNDTQKQRLSYKEKMPNSYVNVEKMKRSSNLQTEAKEGTSNGNDSNVNSSNKSFKENGKRRRSSKLHGVKDKQQMKSKSENRYNVSKENIQAAVHSDVVKLVSKETIISRMIEIDVEIHKLMMEKMTLYKLLENERLNEGISPDSSTPSDDRRKEILKVRPDAPTVISQLIKNTDMSSNTSAQAAIKPNTENTLPKKRKHKHERANVDKSKSDSVRRKRSEAYLNPSSDDEEMMRYAEHAKSMSPSKKKRRKIEEAAGRDIALEMESVGVTETAEIDKKQSETKTTSKKNHMNESTQITKQSFRNVKYQKTRETDMLRSANEALNENVIDSTNQFIGYKSQTYDSDNSKAKPCQSSLSLTTPIYSDESTLDSLDQGSSSAKSDSKKSTGLALLEETFKREMAASKKSKTVEARRKKKKQIKNLLSTVNNLTVEEEELPLNKLYIRKLQQKRDLLVSLDNQIETTNTVKTLPEKSEDTSKHLDEVINDVAENRIEVFTENPSESQLIDNAIEKVSSTQMEDDECLTATQAFADDSLMDETVEANSSYPSSQTKQSTQGFTPTSLADSCILKASEDVTNNSADIHQSTTVREEREPVGSTQIDNINETASMSQRTMENVLEHCKSAEDSEKDAKDVHDGTRTKVVAEPDTKIRRSRSNEKLDADQNTLDEVDKCKGETDDTQLMNPKVEQNTAPPAEATKSEPNLSEKDQIDTIHQQTAIPNTPSEDVTSNNEQSPISPAEDARKHDERDSTANETMCTFTGLNDQTNFPKPITLDVKNDKDKSLPKHEGNEDIDTGSTQSKEATANLLLEQTVGNTLDTNRESHVILEPITDSSIANAPDKPGCETDKTSNDENTSGKGVARKRKKGRKPQSMSKRVDREEKKNSDVNKSLLNVKGSRQTGSSIQEKSTKSTVSSKPLRSSQSSHELADNVSSNTTRRIATRRPQSIGNRKHGSCDFPVASTMDTGDHQESHSRAVKRKQHSMWEMMNCKVRLVDSKYTILRPDANLNMLRQLGISTINHYVRRKSTQVDSTVNFYQGKDSQEARMPTENLVVPQSTKHKDTIESLHDTLRVVLKSDNKLRERVVQSSGQGRLTRSEKSQGKSSIDALGSCNSKSSAKFVEKSVATNSHDKLSVDLLINYEENPDIEILEEKIHVKEQPRHTEDIPASCELDIVEEIEQPRTQYTAHKGPILDIKIFNDSFLAASEDGMIYRYNQASNELLNVYKGHKAAVTCLYIHKMSNVESTREYMYSGALDGTLRCYDIVSGVEIKGAIQIGSPIQCMDQAWGIIFIGTKSGHVSRFYVKSNDVRGDTIQFSDKSVLALKATNEGPRKVLIVASRNQPITIRDAQTGLFLRIISGQKSHTVYSLMRHNNLIYCGTSSTSIPVFDFTNGEQTMQYNAGVGIVCMRLYQQLLFAGCYDGNIYVFDTKDRRLVCSIPGPGNMLLSMEIVRYKIIAGSKDKHLQTWLMPRQVRDLLNE